MRVHSVLTPDAEAALQLFPFKNLPMTCDPQKERLTRILEQLLPDLTQRRRQGVQTQTVVVAMTFFPGPPQDLYTRQLGELPQL